MDCALSCVCDSRYNGVDCSVPDSDLTSLRKTNKILLDALSLAKKQVLGDPDCDFHEQMTDNFLSIIAGDPGLLPEDLVESAFEDFAVAVNSSSYQDCIQEGTLAERAQEVNFNTSTQIYTCPRY